VVKIDFARITWDLRKNERKKERKKEKRKKEKETHNSYAYLPSLNKIL